MRYLAGILIQLLNFRLLISPFPFILVLFLFIGHRDSSCIQKVNRPGSYLLSVHSKLESIINQFYLQATGMQSSIFASRTGMELPFPKLNRKGKSSYRQSVEIRKFLFKSPAVDQYEKVAAKYKSYINDLSPTIEKVYEKENYRNYLKEQKLNMIKSQLHDKKYALEKQLQEKLDPAKSPNGKLHTEILSLTELETNYQSILADIQKKIHEKQEEIKCLQEFVKNQKDTIKGLLKFDFKQTQQNISLKLPKINRHTSESSFWSRESGKSTYKHSRESIFSKLSSNIFERTHQKVSWEQEKLILLKLLLIFYRSEGEQTQYSAELVDSLEKQVTLRQQLIKQVKKELADIQNQKQLDLSHYD